MGKFSDSPYFLLSDFFLGKGDIYNISSTRPILQYTWPVLWTDRDYVTFNDREGVVWNLRYYYDPNTPSTDGSYLVGPMTNIITNGDGLVELWIKETEEPIKKFFPITLRFDSIQEKNNFVFTDADLHNLQPGPSADSLTGLRYWFTFYDTTDLNYYDLIENDRETYFRKDSVYHEWLTSIAPVYYPYTWDQEVDIRNYVNSDTIYSYFGNIFKYIQTENSFHIVYDGLKEYVMRAIPYHQRTPNFNEFTDLFFDKRWHEVYNQIKNIWTLIDPMEIDEDFLGYLSKYYYMYDLISPTLFRQREFVRDLVWLLKRKGTYTEFYIIWRAIANTNNALNIYEFWHDREIINREDTHVLPDEWEEYIYVEKPEYEFNANIGGAGIGWYNRTYGLSGETIVNTTAPSAFSNYPVTLDTYPTDGRILATRYKLEIDVSTEPLLPNAIINKKMWDELWQYWELVRPVNRVVDYNILIAPITDFSGQFISLYDYSPNAYDLTKTLINLRLPDGWIEPFTEPSSGCIAYHNLPLSAQMSASPSACNWIIDHDLNTKYLHTMAVDIDLNQIVPREIEIVSKSRVIMYWDSPVTGYAILKKSQTYSVGGSPYGYPWRMYHYRKNKEVIIEFHNNDLVINANTVSLDSINYASIDSGDSFPNTTPASSGAYVFIQDEPESTWLVPHRLYYRGVILAVYDNDNKQILQYNLNLTAFNECTLSFDTPTAGYAVLIPVANLSWEDIISEFRKALINSDWRGAENYGDLESGTFSASGDIIANQIYEDENFFYINVNVPTEVSGVFREFAVYDDSGNILVYTKCSELYKAAGTTLVLHFRVEKTTGGIINTL